NQPPTFTASNPPAVFENAGPQSVANWATGFNPGPANESGQAVLAYHVTAVGNPALFATAPAVANNGTLTYTPAANTSGTSTFIVVTGNPNLFSSLPAVSPSGTLTYTLAPLTFGNTLVSVWLHNNGGTANGGHDTSPVQQFTITVTSVNHAPVLGVSSATLPS